jgi:hypothetical protein
MRTFITLLTVATLVVACGDEPHPTGPESRSANGQPRATSDKAPTEQAKPVDQIGFTKITRVYGTQVAVPAGASGASTATCPAGTMLISGGHFILGAAAATGAPRLSQSIDNDANGWSVLFANNFTGAGSISFLAVAYCVQLNRPPHQHFGELPQCES